LEKNFQIQKYEGRKKPKVQRKIDLEDKQNKVKFRRKVKGQQRRKCRNDKKLARVVIHHMSEGCNNASSLVEASQGVLSSRHLSLVYAFIYTIQLRLKYNPIFR